MYKKPDWQLRACAGVSAALGLFLTALGLLGRPLGLYFSDAELSALLCFGGAAFALCALSLLFILLRRRMRSRLMERGVAAEAKLVSIVSDRRVHRGSGTGRFMVTCRYEFRGKQYRSYISGLKLGPSPDCSPRVYLDPRRPRRAVIDPYSLYR